MTDSSGMAAGKDSPMKRIARVLLLPACLAGGWFMTSAGLLTVAEAGPPQAPHTVKLQWHASTTPNVRYNVYRGTTPGVHDKRLNITPLNQLYFVDTTIVNSGTYCYVVRAENALPKESADSNEACVTIH